MDWPHDMSWVWFALGIILLAIELSAGTAFYLLWLGIAAIIVGILAWLLPNFHWAWELMTFGLMAILVLVGWWYYSKHYRHVTSQAPTLNRRTQSYVGRVFTLTNAIVNGRGKIKVDDSFWTVTGKDCPAGSKVKVVGAKGLKLEVKVVDS